MRSVALLATMAAQVAFLYGCAGIVAKDTTTTPPPPPPTSQLSVTPSSISFGSVADGTTNSQTVQLKNTGSASLTISKATITGLGFSESGISLPMTLAASATSNFTVKFAPQGAGNASGTLTLTSDAPNSPLVVAVTGSGTSSSLALTVSPTNLSFGNENVGSVSVAQDFKITNTGNGNVAISSIKSSGGGFTVASGGSAVTLTPTQSVTVGVQFAPTSAGSATANIAVTSNATGSPTKVNLSGTGVAVPSGAHTAALSWTPSSSSVSGYNVYRSTVNGSSYIRLNGSLIGGASYTDSSVANGTTYYYVTTAVDSIGNESSFSNQVQALIP